MSGPTLVDMANRTRPMAGKKRWIQDAIPKGHEGVFSTKAKRAGKTTRVFAQEHKGDDGKTGRQARLALTLMGMSKKRSLGDLYKRKD